ncbi:MAG: GNAT family N-acetyltransferase [Cyanobacteria bacterium P01_A01_bin.40]
MSDHKLDFSVRKFTSEDINTVSQLKQNSIRSLNSRDYTHEQTQVLIDRYSREFNSGEIAFINYIANFFDTFSNPSSDLNQAKALVAHIDDQIIGYAAISNLDWLNNSQTLYELFVHPEYIRKGVGTKLLQTLETNVENNCKVINLFASLTGKPFYQANGYKIVNYSSFYIEGTRIPIVKMEKWLVKPSETEKFFWDISQQGKRNIEWLATETVAFFRETFS